MVFTETTHKLIKSKIKRKKVFPIFYVRPHIIRRVVQISNGTPEYLIDFENHVVIKTVLKWQKAEKFWAVYERDSGVLLARSISRLFQSECPFGKNISWKSENRPTGTALMDSKEESRFGLMSFSIEFKDRIRKNDDCQSRCAIF